MIEKFLKKININLKPPLYTPDCNETCRGLLCYKWCLRQDLTDVLHLLVKHEDVYVTILQLYYDEKHLSLRINMTPYNPGLTIATPNVCLNFDICMDKRGIMNYLLAYHCFLKDNVYRFQQTIKWFNQLVHPLCMKPVRVVDKYIYVITSSVRLNIYETETDKYIMYSGSTGEYWYIKAKVLVKPSLRETMRMVKLLRKIIEVLVN